MAANGGDVEVVDFEPDEDDLMDEDAGADMDDPSLGPPVPRLRSTITPAGGGDASHGGPKKTKGRGFRDEATAERSSRMAGKDFDSLNSDGGPGHLRCKPSCFFLWEIRVC